MICIAIVSIFIIVRSDNYEWKVRQHMDEAERYFSELEYEKAIAEYNIVIEIDPKSIDAFLRITEAYILLAKKAEDEEDIEGAVNILTEAEQVLKGGYENTKNEDIRTKLNDIIIYVERLSMDSVEAEKKMDEISQVVDLNEIVESIDTYEGKDINIERIVVDGIIHHGYNSVKLSTEESIFLDKIIDACEGGQTDMASRFLEEQEYYDLVSIHKDSEYYEGDSCIHILYREYKIFADYVESDDSIKNIVLIPCYEGKGYLMGIHKYHRSDGSSYWGRHYGVCDCFEGMFNGKFSIIDETDEEGSNHIEGMVVNGLLDGLLVRRWDGDGEMKGEFSLGKAVSITEDGNKDVPSWGKYIYMSNEDGSLSATLPDWQNPMDWYFFIYPEGYSYSTGIQEEDGIFIYPY